MVKCSFCASDGARYKCAKCDTAYYCGDKCQRAHWIAENGHETFCAPLVAGSEYWDPSFKEYRGAFSGKRFDTKQHAAFCKHVLENKEFYLNIMEDGDEEKKQLESLFRNASKLRVQTPYEIDFDLARDMIQYLSGYSDDRLAYFGVADMIAKRYTRDVFSRPKVSSEQDRRQRPAPAAGNIGLTIREIEEKQRQARKERQREREERAAREREVAEAAAAREREQAERDREADEEVARREREAARRAAERERELMRSVDRQIAGTPSGEVLRPQKNMTTGQLRRTMMHNMAARREVLIVILAATLQYFFFYMITHVVKGITDDACFGGVNSPSLRQWPGGTAALAIFNSAYIPVKTLFNITQPMPTCSFWNQAFYWTHAMMYTSVLITIGDNSFTRRALAVIGRGRLQNVAKDWRVLFASNVAGVAKNTSRALVTPVIDRLFGTVPSREEVPGSGPDIEELDAQKS